MKKTIWVLAIVLSLYALPVNAQEKIVFDGYWWGTLTLAQKLGYVQGFMNGFNTSTLVCLAITDEEIVKKKTMDEEMMKSFVDKLTRQYWFNYSFKHTFGYYIDRIDGYYKTTENMKTLVSDVMRDLTELQE